ncbi:hypothetical protein B0T09DRAFT_261640 [Sordaria sp. MPI-SDFR-AT-0083]|nr:hypothetical protein B0T09DRAFT_261640 [Sordaria sp. MPI-SDFR-AT-0083]
MDSADTPADTPTGTPARTSQQAHPRRIAPMRAPFSPRIMRRQNTPTRLPEDFVHTAGQAPVAFNGEQPNLPARRAFVPVSNSSQEPPSRLIPSQEQTGRQSRRRPCSPSPNPRPSTRRRLTLASEDTSNEVTLPQVAVSSARRPYGTGPEPEVESARSPFARPQNPKISDERFTEMRRRVIASKITSNDYAKCVAGIRRIAMVAMDSDERPAKSKQRLHAAIANEVAKVAPFLPLPSAPQADPLLPPPAYARRDPWQHPIGTDYDLRRNIYGRQHNNGAPRLPLYTPFRGLGERVLQFGGEEEEQRRAFVKWLEEECCREKDERECLLPQRATGILLLEELNKLLTFTTTLEQYQRYRSSSTRRI